jgi:hypothetical protein
MAELKTLLKEPNPYKLDAIGECQLRAIMHVLKNRDDQTSSGQVELDAVNKIQATNLNYAIEDAYNGLMQQGAIKPMACPARR